MSHLPDADAAGESLASHGQGTELFRLLVESVKDYAIFMLDPSGRVASWNAGAAGIKGYAADEIIGQHFSIFYPPADVAAGKCAFELEVAARVGRFEDEGWRVRKDGCRFWANVVITAVRGSSGALLGFAKVTRDLTARVQAEEERVRTVRAEEGERRREDFLAVMGHELRNPLAPMVTAVHMIKLRRGIKCEKEIAVLERQVVHMMRLLDDLLDVSKTLRDKVNLAPKPKEIGQLLADAVDAAGPHIEERRHTLHLDLPTAPMVVDVDDERITQVFVNLLNNAAKYTDPGGQITVRASCTADWIEVVIEDDGMGIAPDVLPRIFELFTQGAQTRERQLGGFGVGLAVAHRLVKEHGGEIAASSEGSGKGSRFTVRLPRSAAPVPEPPVLERPPSPPVGHALRRCVLVVDDNHDSGEMMSAFLGGLGHDVHVAHDGPDGIKLAHAVSPDIAFLDIGLPGMSGFELARRLRTIPACATIPIVAVSGYARESDRKEALGAGFSAHFAKPLDPSTLEEVVAQAARVSSYSS
jgi:PAS domain S-box-containing protein